MNAFPATATDYSDSKIAIMTVTLRSLAKIHLCRAGRRLTARRLRVRVAASRRCEKVYARSARFAERGAPF